MVCRMVLSHGLRQWARRAGGQELLTWRERLQWNAFAVGRLGGEVTVSEQPCFVRRWHRAVQRFRAVGRGWFHRARGGLVARRDP